MNVRERWAHDYRNFRASYSLLIRMRRLRQISIDARMPSFMLNYGD